MNETFAYRLKLMFNLRVFLSDYYRELLNDESRRDWFQPRFDTNINNIPRV